MNPHGTAMPHWAPPPAAGPNPWLEVLRIVVGVLGGLAGCCFVPLAALVLSSRFSTSAMSDPHGYGLVFGTVMAVPLGVFAAFALPFAFPRRRWLLALAICAPIFLGSTAGLVVALLTA